MRTCAFVIVLAILLPGLLPASLSADIKGADPGAYTDRKYREEWAAYLMKIMGEAYKSAGVKNAAWDKEAGEFLDAMALYFANEGAGQRHWLDGALNSDKLLEMAKNLVEGKNCGDWLVRSCYGLLILDNVERLQNIPPVSSAIAQLGTTKYPPAVKFFLAGRYQRHSSKIAEPAQLKDGVLQTMRGNLIPACSAPNGLPGIERRVLLSWMEETVLSQSAAVQSQVVDLIGAAPAFDPWLREMISGRYRIKAAWEGRGSGFANTVTEQGWRDFRAHLGHARTHLSRAWNIDKTLPEAPAHMIVVVMGDGPAEPGESPRTWFDRSTEAQFDYFFAYQALYSAMLPRWGGNYRAIYNVGLEAAATQRFDTGAPWMLIYAIDRIKDDAGGDFAAVRSVAKYSDVKKLLEGELAYPNLRITPDWFRSTQAALAWKFDEKEEAQRVLASIETEPHATVFERYGVTPAEIVNHISPGTGPHAETIASAEAMRRRGRVSAALDAFKDIESKLADDDPARAMVHARVITLTAMRDFNDGKTVKLQPASIDDGWQVLAGTWTIEPDGALRGVATEDGCSIVLDADFGTRYELAGTVDFPKATGPREETAGGPIVCFVDKTAHIRCMVLPSTNQITLVDGRNRGYTFDASTADHNTFVVRIFGANIWAEINGKEILGGEELVSRLGPEGSIGLSGPAQVPGRSATFRNLTIRKIGAPPPLTAKPREQK